MSTPPPLFGLILAGGASTRMQRDKATLSYHGRTQLEWAYDLAAKVCIATFVSVRPDQRDEPTRARFPQIVDRQPGIGPIAGICAALAEHRRAAWLVLACDLPFLTEGVLDTLVRARNPAQLATAYRSAHDGLPEPLCAIWEPSALEAVQTHIAAGKQCPRKLLINSDVKLIDLPEASVLDNVNTADEFSAAQQKLQATSSQVGTSSIASSTSHASLAIRVQYFAILRERVGRAEEHIDTRARTPAELYAQLQARHGFQLAPTQLKVAINSEFRDWQTPLSNGDTVVFIPPVAGG